MFELSINPVQEFIEQARRTRDLHAGSLLVSWLAGCALLSIRERAKLGGSSGAFRRPQISASSLDVLTYPRPKPTTGLSDDPRWPNRIRVYVDNDFDPENGREVVADVLAAWRALAQRVWDMDMAGVASTSSPTAGIWRRQVEGQFQVSWMITAHPSDSLSSRKLLRDSHRLPEPGFKCTMCGDLQELSGASSQLELEAFWRGVRAWLSRARGASQVVVEEEHLSAPAYIKRRMRDLGEGVLIQNFAGRAGLDLAIPGVGRKRTPSTSDVALGPWARAFRVPGKTRNEHDVRLVDEMSGLLANLGDDSGRNLARGHKGWSSFDARDVFEVGLGRARSQASQKLKPFLASLRPYYAVLRMDLDRLGSIDSRYADLVNRFAQEAPMVVQSAACGGYSVYSSGDEFLAFLPMQSALRAATEVRQWFDQEARKVAGLPTVLHVGADQHKRPTVSGALVFSRIDWPLTRTLRLATELLGKEAKERAGRDAIAIQVAKPGGLGQAWVQPWETALGPAAADGSRAMDIEWITSRLAGSGATSDAGDDVGLTSGFIYAARKTFQILADSGLPSHQTRELAQGMLVAELLRNQKGAAMNPGLAGQMVSRLLRQCIRVQHIGVPVKGGTLWGPQIAPNEHASMAPAMIARFLLNPEELR